MAHNNNYKPEKSFKSSILCFKKFFALKTILLIVFIVVPFELFFITFCSSDMKGMIKKSPQWETETEVKILQGSFNTIYKTNNKKV